MTDPDALLTLDQAATLVPGADAGTLKRLIRCGKLSATRPGKSYLTTLADVREMIERCRVMPKVRDSGFVLPAPTALLPLGSSSIESGKRELALAREQAREKRNRR